MNTLTYTSRKKSQRDGFTIVEVMVSVAIIIIVALGTLSFQYYCVKNSRSSEAQATATRLGQLLLEDWKSTGGDPDYDPNSLNLGLPTDLHIIAVEIIEDMEFSEEFTTPLKERYPRILEEVFALVKWVMG